MRMLIDTNVIMDVLVGREPFLHDSRQVLKMCKNKQIHGYLAAHTITNLFYILRKYYPSDECHDILLDLFDIFSVISVDDRKLRLALANKRCKDFEDCLQMECGRAVDVRYIVTRDASDFMDSDIPCLTPSKVCAMYSDTI